MKQLLHEHIHECLLRGYPTETFVPRSDWFTGWEYEYGLSMRKPNRKYKVPKAVLEQRLEIGWLNLARVRTLCIDIHGYDPEMENWDQSPFHNNEVGSQNAPTLAVAGTIEVPLIENHSATRERWSGCFTTWSSAELILEEGPPGCELMFKAEGHIIELRIREHIRSRGFGPWLTVCTAPKGSYRADDVLNFLEAHLPLMVGERRWRIIMADDYTAHKCDNVKRLCWDRGYVLLPHGGGVTAVAQTPDTDLNQHVRRLYTAKESAELIKQMSQGICVPKAKEETAIDMMADVLGNLELHLNAAKGYKYTGQTIALDGSEDDQVCREAGTFFRDLNMRPKINAAVAAVREEVAAKRLSWSREEVESLIKPYPNHKEVDAVLEKQEDDTWLDAMEKPYQEEESDKESVHNGSEDAPEEDEKCGEKEECNIEDTTLEEVSDVEADHAVAETGREITLSEVDAETVIQSHTKLEAFKQSLEALRACGALTAAVHLENEIRKEMRGMRVCSCLLYTHDAADDLTR